MKLVDILRPRAIVCAALIGFSALAGHAQASSGIFGIDIGLASNTINSGTKTFFEADLLGDSRHAPTGLGTVTLNTSGFNGLNLGSFNLATDTLKLVGGGVLTFKNGGSDVLNAVINYSIDSNAFQSVNLPFNQDNVSGNTGDQRWASVSSSVDLLSGLTAGSHTLTFYAQSSVDGGGTVFDNRGGSNYTASFTVTPVPEPATWLGGMLMVGLAGYGLHRRLRGTPAHARTTVA